MSEAEYRERFVATLTHDLRSPLAAALMGAHMIAQSPNDPEQVRDWANRIAESVERMDRLINAVEESDDMTWTSIRESRLKEAGEVRVWATEHGYKLS